MKFLKALFSRNSSGISPGEERAESGENRERRVQRERQAGWRRVLAHREGEQRGGGRGKREGQLAVGEAALERDAERVAEEALHQRVLRQGGVRADEPGELVEAQNTCKAERAKSNLSRIPPRISSEILRELALVILWCWVLWQSVVVNWRIIHACMQQSLLSQERAHAECHTIG